MAILLLSTSIIAFVVYFYAIGLWYIGFLPIIVLGILFAYYGVTKDLQIKSSDLLQRYSLMIAWLVVLAWLVGILNFFGAELITICLALIAINIFLWFGSYMVGYQDGKSVFQIGYYLSILFLCIVMLVFDGGTGLWNTFRMMWVMHLGVSAFLIFIMWLKTPIERYFGYMLWILILWTLILVITDQIPNFYFALSLNSILLTGVYYRIFHVLKHQPISNEKKAHISVRRILAGERITQVKKYFASELQKKIYAFILAMPQWAKKLLELMNIAIIATLIYYYISNIAWFAHINHLFYRFVIIVFVINVLLLKRIGYNSIFQNLVVFLVINFAIYISLFSYFNGDVWAIVGRAIVRNIVSASLMFYAHKVPLLAKIFSSIEYSYRLIATLAALVVNIVLLRNTNIPGELTFFLVLLYVGLEWMILFYGAKYVQKRMSMINDR